MSAALHDLAEAARVLRDAVKDRSYRATPLGLEVARYYRWKKTEWGAAAETLRDYEPPLAHLALFFADLELPDLEPPVGTERVREAWEHQYGERSPRTRSKVLSIYRDFFSWCCRERGMVGNPALAIRRPKAVDVDIDTFPPSFVANVIGSQTYPADWVGCTLILRYGLRRSGVVNARLRDFDFERQQMRVKTKGGRIHWLPLVDDVLWLKVEELSLLGWQPDHWLLYHSDTRRRKVDLEDATETLTIGGQQVGYADVTTRRHDKRPTPKIAHFWWYRCLERAGVVTKGTTAGTNMHRGRHTSATELLRDSHNLKLTQQLLGHADIRSTARYAHLDTDDLAAALRGLYGDEE